MVNKNFLITFVRLLLNIGLWLNTSHNTQQYGNPLNRLDAYWCDSSKPITIYKSKYLKMI